MNAKVTLAVSGTWDLLFSCGDMKALIANSFALSMTFKLYASTLYCRINSFSLYAGLSYMFYL